MNHLDLRSLFQRYQAGQCTPAERQQVEAWYEELETGQPLLLTTEEQEQLRQALWSRIAASTIAPGAPPAPRRGPAARWAAAAAVAAGLSLGAWYVAQRPAAGVATATTQLSAPTTATVWRSYRNPTRHSVALQLPDGSTVQLAPASRLRYPARFAGARRVVQLVGEGFFRIQHDAAHPFQVYTEQVVTTVLGTSFRVRAYAGQPAALVQVSTGRVRVTPRQLPPATAGTASVVVLPNQQAVYAAGAQPLRRELVPDPVQLQPQPLVFQDQPVPAVLAALATAYGVAIDYDAAALAGCSVTLNLQAGDLYAKLAVLCKVLDASYQEHDGRIAFRSAGCQNP